MAVTVTVEDAHNAAKPFQRFTLELASETLTAAELIGRRVRREVEQHAHGIVPLVAAGEVEHALNEPAGVRLARQIERSTRAAVAGLSQHRFLLFVDDRQIEAADEQITLTRASTVSFVRLIPLQGG